MPNHHPDHDTDPGTNSDTEGPDSEAAITAAYAAMAADPETHLSYEHVAFPANRGQVTKLPRVPQQQVC